MTHEGVVNCFLFGASLEALKEEVLALAVQGMAGRQGKGGTGAFKQTKAGKE